MMPGQPVASDHQPTEVVLIYCVFHYTATIASTHVLLLPEFSNVIKISSVCCPSIIFCVGTTVELL